MIFLLEGCCCAGWGKRLLLIRQMKFPKGIVYTLTINFTTLDEQIFITLYLLQYESYFFVTPFKIEHENDYTKRP